MKLLELYIENFGRFSRHRIKFNSGMNSYLHENGYGKTTVTAFIQAMLYGLSDTKKADLDENDRRHYLPWGGGAAGGWLSFSVNGKDYRIERSFGARAQDDTFKLLDLAAGRECKDFTDPPGRAIFGIDRDGFERTVFLSERNLSGKNENKSISEKLSGCTGTDFDVGDMDGAIKLLEERRKYYYKRGGSGEIADRRARLSSAERELEEINLARVEYNKLLTELQELEKEMSELEKERRTAEAQLISFGKMQEERANRERYLALSKQKEESLARLSELNEFFAAGVPELSELEAARSAKDAAQRAPCARERNPELAELTERLTSLSREEIEAAKSSLHEKKRGLNSVCLIAASAILVLSIILFFINVTAGFVSLLIGVLFLILSTILGKNQDNGRAAREILKRLSISNYTSAEAELDKLLESFIRLEFLKEQENKRLAEEKIAESTRLEAERKYLDFLSKYPTVTPDPFGEILNHIYERRALKKSISELPELPELKKIGEPSPQASDPTERLTEIRRTASELSARMSRYTDRISSLELFLESEDTVQGRITECREQLEKSEKNLFYIQKSKELLEKASEALNARYLGGAKEAFAEYARLLGDEAGEYLMSTSFEISKNEHGAARPSEAFSLGTRNLQYLATRLALIDALFEDETPFLVFDDPFISFDDAHAAAAINLLKRLSEKRQIIYFTCSSSRAI